jgi:hypothetical protein
VAPQPIRNATDINTCELKSLDGNCHLSVMTKTPLHLKDFHNQSFMENNKIMIEIRVALIKEKKIAQIKIKQKN